MTLLPVNLTLPSGNPSPWTLNELRSCPSQITSRIRSACPWPFSGLQPATVMISPNWFLKLVPLSGACSRPYVPAQVSQPHSPLPLFTTGPSPPNYPGKQPRCSSAQSHTATPSGTSLLSHQIPCLPSESKVTLMRAENIHMGAVYQVLAGNPTHTPFHRPGHQSHSSSPQTEWDG